MTRYRVTLRATSFEIVDAENPYQAAVLASGRHGSDVEVTQVARAVGRAPAAKVGKRGAVTKRAGAKKTKKAATKRAPAKKKRQLSPEMRAKLAQNLVKARAARAAKRKAAATKKTAKKRSAKRR